jgi:hypothetical protein
MKLAFFIARLREPSTWSALAALVAAFAPDVGSAVQQVAEAATGAQALGGTPAAVGAAVAASMAVVGMLKREKGGKHADADA